MYDAVSNELLFEYPLGAQNYYFEKAHSRQGWKDFKWLVSKRSYLSFSDKEIFTDASKFELVDDVYYVVKGRIEASSDEIDESAIGGELTWLILRGELKNYLASL